MSPDRLRELLFDAIASGDGETLRALCQSHQELIVSRFAEWKRRVAEVAADERLLERYASSLVFLAEHFARALGRPELRRILVPDDQPDPRSEWAAALERARTLLGQGRHAAARQVVEDLLIDVRDHRGPGMRPVLSLSHGILAHAYFHDGRVEEAITPAENALEMCAMDGEGENVLVYLELLYEVHRYLGRTREAADMAARAADLNAELDRTTEAGRWRRQAEIVRAGEPLNRVRARLGDRNYELDEVPVGERSDKIEMVFERNRTTLHCGRVLTKEGEEKGAKGDYEGAVALFEEAARRDPYDPQCRYERGVALAYLGRHDRALECMRAAEDLAPGWFRTRTYVWLLREIVAGRLGPKVFEVASSLESDGMAPEAQLKAADALLIAYPRLAVAHLGRGLALMRLGRHEDAEASFRVGLTGDGEASSRTRLLYCLGVVTPSAQERVALWDEAVHLGGDLVMAGMAQVSLRLGLRGPDRAARLDAS